MMTAKLFLLPVFLFCILTARGQMLKPADLIKLYDLPDQQLDTVMRWQMTFKLEVSNVIDQEKVTRYTRTTPTLTEYITIRQGADLKIPHELQYALKPKYFADTVAKQLTDAGFKMISSQNSFDGQTMRYLKGKYEVTIAKRDNDPFAAITIWAQ